MNSDKLLQLSLKLLVTIIDRDMVNTLENLLREKHVHLHYMFNALGSARSEMLKSIGLSGTNKTVCICVAPDIRVHSLMASVVDRLSLTHSGLGVAYIVPISSASATISNIFSEEHEHMNERLERLEKLMDTELEEIKEEANYALVVSVINQGFSETLLEAARSLGIRGGTIIHARRSGIEDAVKFFGVTLNAEKEIVAMLTPRELKKELMQLIAKKCGLNTEAHGIVFSLPIESYAGINIDEKTHHHI